MNTSEHLPPFSGATEWLNSPPLTTENLRGQVVLVDFWTYSCINWIRTLPYLRAWAKRYEGDGLVVIGVHAPEFRFEHDIGAVASVMRERGIDYPVAIDNDFAIWSAFRNQYWPAVYLADTSGVIRYHHFGEGSYDQTERVIQQLLTSTGVTNLDPEPVSVDPRGDEVAADSSALKTPETYVGYQRMQKFASPSGEIPRRSHHYALPSDLRSNQWALSGAWTIGAQSATLDEPSGRIAFRFQARDLNLVMGSSTSEPISFRVTLDGSPPSGAHGLDVDDHGDGSVSEPRVYQLIRQPGRVVERTFEIAFDGPGVDAYVFTFG